MNEALQRYREAVFGKTVALLGMGVSNRAAVDFLLSMGAVITARDKNPNPDGALRAFLSERGVRMIFGEDYLKGIDEDIVYKSPGIRFDLPELLSARERGCEITSEMEVFCRLCPARLFAVTGSDGKTTTTTIVSEMLKRTAAKTGGRVYLGGNIGTPLLPYLTEMTENDFAVLELSSFQLHTMRPKPVSAIVTNVTPNHLNWHVDMAEYTESKKNIFRAQDAGDRLVLNAENALTRAMADEAAARVTLFSSACDPGGARACFLRDGAIVYRDGAQEYEIMRREDILIPGLHNAENYMAAISAVWGTADAQDMRAVAKEFGGVAHRLQLVSERGGVRYYNSSIDTSPTRTLAALSCFDGGLVTIVGGYDKNIPIEPMLFELMKKSAHIVGTGQTGEAVVNAVLALGYPAERAVYLAQFDRAVTHAMTLAAPGGAVLLSPAAASFDAFKNFMERGRRFCELVEKAGSDEGC